MSFHYFFHLILIFSLHCQLFLRISALQKTCNIIITSQCKIFIVPEEGWFVQPKYSTYVKPFHVVPVSASIFSIPHLLRLGTACQDGCPVPAIATIVLAISNLNKNPVSMGRMMQHYVPTVTSLENCHSNSERCDHCGTAVAVLNVE